jgi:hypothetical protein
LREVEDWMLLPRDVKAAADAKRVRRERTLILKVCWDGLYRRKGYGSAKASEIMSKAKDSETVAFGFSACWA